ncbi:methylmalonyl Co-A mutase-associated GTPase MeaB [Chloroflexota bacterium]
MMEAIEKMLAGDQRMLARLISIAEQEGPEVPEIMEAIYPHTGKAYCVGVTGLPGGGKSTLVDKLVSVARSKGLSVGVIAVDPTSPFTGGAVLGDRIRMQQHYLDEGVFIRSMATRGSLGGLPKTASAVMKILDASGKDVIFVETVGVGQSEIDIMKTVDTTVVLIVPEAGDTVQTMKAGLLEIADIFVVNKADHLGAEYMVAELEAMLHLGIGQPWWQVPVLKTQAVNDIGIKELYEQIERHYLAMKQSGTLASKRQQQRKGVLLQNIECKIMTQVEESIENNGQLTSYIEKVEKGEINPYSAAKEILSNQNFVETWLCALKKT